MSIANTTVADVIAQACAAHGVKRAFGVPGGGSSLDMIASLARCGIQFHLCRTETAAAIMASADAEINGGFGVAIATQGPGAASAMNGLAHAWLDRAPVLFISDGWTTAQGVLDTHQVFDQFAMSAPVVKASSRLDSADPQSELDVIIGRMLAPPWGPAHLELTGENARRVIDSGQVRAATGRPPAASVASADSTKPGDAAALLRNSKRPVLLVGLEAREQGAPDAILDMAQRLNCPVLTTYKAKGIVGDESPLVIGHFTGGAAEGPCISAADLIILCGLDPVELIGKPWPYKAPVIDIALVAHPVHYVRPQAAMHGPLAASVASLLPACGASAWSANELAALKADMLARLACPPATAGLSPQQVVQVALKAAAPQRPFITVDAGAHMFSAMAFWQATQPVGALISNGLATMAYALPAGIARALASPGATTIAFTGDGGLLMCAGELATAVQSRARVCVIVFNDASLSLIALKQQNRGMADAGVTLTRVDFAGVARGMGLKGFTATNTTEYEEALRLALQEEGPTLIDVLVDPSGYRAQAKALRG